MNAPIAQLMFNIDIPTVMKILSWENFLFGILVAIYRVPRREDARNGKMPFYAASKFVQALAWAMIDFSASPDRHFLMIGGNMLLFAGVLIESRVIMETVGVKRSLTYRIQAIAFLAAMLFFYVSEASMNGDRNYYFLTHLVITSLFLFPGIFCLSLARGSKLKIVMGSLYVLFFITSIYRYILELLGFRFLPGGDMLGEDLFFFMFVSIMLIGGTGYLLLAKEDDDRRLKEMAYLDSLTGLLNRRHFSEEAALAFARHARSGKAIAVLFIDIDHFKKVNDTYGHKFGDDVLRNLSSLMRKTVRTTDLTCRWGGEEFVILLSESSDEHALMVARRIQRGIGLSSLSAHPEFSYTVSVGIYAAAIGSTGGETLETFIEKSDRALYRAKVLGRNRIEFFNEGK